MESFEFNGESDLDLEYAMSLVYPQQVTLYQIGDLIEGASFNNFLDAIDGSYCTYDGGDDPTQDGIYPDPFGPGFEGPENCVCLNSITEHNFLTRDREASRPPR
jgi:tripeptidyl-peptidase I